MKLSNRTFKNVSGGFTTTGRFFTDKKMTKKIALFPWRVYTSFKEVWRHGQNF